jgi:hypothetical protein
MLPPLRHLILPLVFPGIRVSLVFIVDYSMYLIWALILTADFSVYMARLTEFDCGLFRSLNLDTLNLTAYIWFWNGAYGRCDRSVGDADSSMAHDPTFAFVGGPCCPTLDFVYICLLDYDYFWHIFYFPILYYSISVYHYTIYKTKYLIKSIKQVGHTPMYFVLFQSTLHVGHVIFRR